MLTTALLAALAVAAPGLTLHLSPDGDDQWSGRLPAPNQDRTDGPLKTLTRARDELRKLAGKLPDGGVVVELAGGVYELQQPFALEKQDSGSEAAPIEYRGRPGAEVRLVGGKVLGAWAKVTEAAELARLAPAARGQVYATDVRAQGVSDLGELRPATTWAQSEAGLELFFQDRPMTLARWPNDGFARITQPLGPTEKDVRGTKGTVEGIIEVNIDSERLARWAAEPQAMVHGYWFWDWADQRHRVESIDAEKKIITIAKPYCSYGYRKNQWFYGYNLLCELDQPGEYYLDRGIGVLYFWPPAQLDGGKPMISVTPSLVTCQDVSHLTVRGLTLEAARQTAVVVKGGTNIRIVGCVIRNVGSWAAQFSGGTDTGVAGCDIYHTGDGGINLAAGVRKTLAPGGLYADNNHIHHFSRVNPVYKPAVILSGVGQRVTHNLIHDAPHMAIGFSGNDHLIELNEIHSVVYESNDAGVMYAGRNSTMRGHVIRHNYIHHIYGFERRGCVGVYLDDMFCSARITGNVFYQVPNAAFIGGGRDNSIDNNVFVDCKPAVHIDSRALGWAAPAMPGLLNQLKEVPIAEEPWKTRFPQLLTYADDEPAVPKYNVVAKNICVGGKWDGIDGKARPHVQFGENLLDQDPKFVDAERLNFQLREDSPAWTMGFERIPVEKIGLYQSPDRASWPVVHEVRQPPEAPPPPPRAQRKEPVVFKVAKGTATPTIDGDLQASEWNGAEAKAAMVIEQGIQGEKLAPRSLAWLAWTPEALWVAIDNAVEGKQPIATTNVWGRDDAVEIAFAQPGGQNLPILVLRGYPNGRWESSEEAGAPPALVKQAAEGVGYAAKVTGKERWTCEWRIPLASLGLDPAKAQRYPFNLSIRKPANNLWLMWQGTAACTWEVLQAGLIELAR